MQAPSAVYTSPSHPIKNFEIDPNDPHYQTTNGRTTGPSDYVLKAGQIDRDKPSDPKMDTTNHGIPTYLSQLRMQLTGLQDDINEFLTKQMENAKNKRIKVEFDKKEKSKLMKGDLNDKSEREDDDVY